MTTARRRWSIACFVLLLALDWRLCFFWIGGEHASTLFIIFLFLGIVALGWGFLTADDIEESPFDNNPDIS